MKGKRKFENYKNCLEATQWNNKIKIKLMQMVFKKITQNS